MILSDIRRNSMIKKRSKSFPVGMIIMLENKIFFIFVIKGNKRMANKFVRLLLDFFLQVMDNVLKASYFFID
jgi:hypothetical protein